ncbi:tRNA pseudouridine synthase A [Metallococcus carri]|uniref:tRNA pseudouridine synthase A n=1 Tax=Metallococcus carri TaxID=1656884 RepID=UPI002E2C374A|nr:tRNA pseudouridine synthase A [Metallococcus carri]
MRLRIDFGYDGTDFSGWAAQPGLRTVEDVLSEGFGRILRTDPPRLTVAGRTDAGVHARGAVCHLDVLPEAYAALPGRSTRSPAEAAVTRLNGVLPADVRVHRVAEAAEGFDARFSATSRRYLYRIADAEAVQDPLRRRDTLWLRSVLSVDALNAASANLLGLKDFAAFCKQREGATTVRTLLAYSWRRASDGVLEGTVVADAFCHSMVRSLVGAVVPVAEGKRGVEWPGEVLAAGRRDPAVAVMPAHGLSLEEVTYPPDAKLAVRANQARAIRTLPGPD